MIVLCLLSSCIETPEARQRRIDKEIEFALSIVKDTPVVRPEDRYVIKSATKSATKSVKSNYCKPPIGAEPTSDDEAMNAMSAFILRGVDLAMFGPDVLTCHPAADIDKDGDSDLIDIWYIQNGEGYRGKK